MRGSRSTSYCCIVAVIFPPGDSPTTNRRPTDRRRKKVGPANSGGKVAGQNSSTERGRLFKRCKHRRPSWALDKSGKLTVEKRNFSSAVDARSYQSFSSSSYENRNVRLFKWNCAEAPDKNFMLITVFLQNSFLFGDLRCGIFLLVRQQIMYLLIPWLFFTQVQRHAFSNDLCCVIEKKK